MELCWSSRLEASIPRSKLNPTPIFLLRAVRIGIDGWKTFRELTSSLAESLFQRVHFCPRADTRAERRVADTIDEAKAAFRAVWERPLSPEMMTRCGR